MFESLSERISGVIDKLRGRGKLSEQDVKDALREVRRALLEADVSLSVVKKFISSVREKAIGEELWKSLTPGQLVVKHVRDELVALWEKHLRDRAAVTPAQKERLARRLMPIVPLVPIALPGGSPR